jgi:hypothetical protein
MHAFCTFTRARMYVLLEIREKVKLAVDRMHGFVFEKVGSQVMES